MRESSVPFASFDVRWPRTRAVGDTDGTMSVAPNRERSKASPSCHCKLATPRLLNESFADADGAEHVLADSLEKGPVLLALYKSSCGASKAMMPVLNRFVDRYGPAGLQVVGVAQDSPNVTRSFARRSGGLDYPILIEGDQYPLSEAFDISPLPPSM